MYDAIRMQWISVCSSNVLLLSHIDDIIYYVCKNERSRCGCLLQRGHKRIVCYFNSRTSKRHALPFLIFSKLPPELQTDPPEADGTPGKRWEKSLRLRRLEKAKHLWVWSRLFSRTCCLLNCYYGCLWAGFVKLELSHVFERCKERQNGSPWQLLIVIVSL